MLGVQSQDSLLCEFVGQGAHTLIIALCLNPSQTFEEPFLRQSKLVSQSHAL